MKTVIHFGQVRCEKNDSADFDERLQWEIPTIIGLQVPVRRRFWKCATDNFITSGNIIIEGKNIKEYTPAILRQYVSISLLNSPLIQGAFHNQLALQMLCKTTNCRKKVLSILEELVPNQNLCSWSGRLKSKKPSSSCNFPGWWAATFTGGADPMLAVEFQWILFFLLTLPRCPASHRFLTYPSKV